MNNSVIIQKYENNAFKGIFSSLREREVNLTDKSFIKDYTNPRSIWRSPLNMLIPGTSKYGEISDNPPSFEYGFRKSLFALNGYSLHTISDSQPIDFKVMCSNDRINWETVDEKSNLEACYNCNLHYDISYTRSYRYIKILVSKTNKIVEGKTKIGFFEFEMFGVLMPNSIYKCTYRTQKKMMNILHFLINIILS